MPRSIFEETEVLAAFAGWLDERPEAGFVAGTAIVADDPVDGVRVQIGHAHCCPVALVAIAAELLDAASTMMRTAADPRPFLPFIQRIEAAQASLTYRPVMPVS